jgi:MFS family permease
MNCIESDIMGTASGTINMAGQMAAIAAPVSIGLIVSLSDGRFGYAFAFLIGSIFLSFVLVLTTPAKMLRHQTVEKR